MRVSDILKDPPLPEQGPEEVVGAFVEDYCQGATEKIEGAQTPDAHVITPGELLVDAAIPERKRVAKITLSQVGPPIIEMDEDHAIGHIEIDIYVAAPEAYDVDVRKKLDLTLIKSADNHWLVSELKPTP
jgi:hypothetical protein